MQQKYRTENAFKLKKGTDNCSVSLLRMLSSITVAELFVFKILQTNSALLASGSALRIYSQISEDTEPVLFPKNPYTSD